MPIPIQRPRLGALTSVRFLAALHVFFFHFQVISGNTWKVPAGNGFSGKLASVGYLGVSFFFVLSGFVLVYTYGERDFDVRSFWRARFARVYPAYLFSLLLTAPFFGFMLVMPLNREMIAFGADWFQRHPVVSVASVLGLMQSWIPRAALAWNAVAWSLSCEAFFYLVFPLALVWMRKRSSAALTTIIAASWLLMLAATSAYAVFSPDGISHVSADNNTLPWLNVIKFNPLMRLPEFMIGVASGVWFLRGERRLNPTLLIAGGATALAVAVQFCGRIPYPVLHTGLLAPAFAAIVVGLAYQPRWSRPLELRVFRLLGDASYSFYLLHATVIGIWAFDAKSAFARGGFGFLVPLGITTVLACVVYVGIEQPARRRLRAKPQPVRAIATTA